MSDSSINDRLTNISNANEILEKLTPDQKLKILAKLYGFSRVPVDINTFIDDDYFMGKFWGKGAIYPYWRDKLTEIYPNPILSPYRIISPKGAIGTGKSTFSQISATYDLYKLSCIENLSETFKLESNSPFTIRCFNLSKSKAYEVLISPMTDRINNSPFFIDYRKIYKTYLPGKCSIQPARKAEDVISECLLFALISEANFFKPWIATEIINTCISRMSSRLQRVEGVFGHIFLDSSSTEKNSVVERFLSNNPFQNITAVYQTSIWEAKKHLGIYFNNGSFKVYAGDSNVNPHILEPNEDISKYDKDRIIEVPNELRNLFENDIIKSLNDQAGISLDSQSEFLPNKEFIIGSASLPQVIDEEIIIDFFDDEQLHDIIGDSILEVLPEDRLIYSRIDLGLSNDKAGISFGFIEQAEYIEVEDKKVFRPKIALPVNFVLSRKYGQETSISKIINFFIWVSTKRSLKEVTTDQYQSSAIRQELTFNGIKTSLLSVDRTDEAYVNFKNLLLSNRIKFSNSELLKFELSNLIRVGSKIDHKPTSSKDNADALVGVVLKITKDGESSADVPDNKILDNINDSLKELVKRKRRLDLLNLR